MPFGVYSVVRNFGFYSGSEFIRSAYASVSSHHITSSNVIKRGPWALRA